MNHNIQPSADDLIHVEFAGAAIIEANLIFISFIYRAARSGAVPKEPSLILRREPINKHRTSKHLYKKDTEKNYLKLASTINHSGTRTVSAPPLSPTARRLLGPSSLGARSSFDLHPPARTFRNNPINLKQSPKTHAVDSPLEASHHWQRAAPVQGVPPFQPPPSTLSEDENNSDTDCDTASGGARSGIGGNQIRYLMEGELLIDGAMLDADDSSSSSSGEEDGEEQKGEERVSTEVSVLSSMIRGRTMARGLERRKSRGFAGRAWGGRRWREALEQCRLAAANASP